MNNKEAADVSRVGTALLHQQLYVIGRDIASKHGNLLLDFGCTRHPSPIPGIPSTYTKSIQRGIRFAMRGFGVFVGDDSLGGIFVHRYTFEPRWMPSSHFLPIPWLPKDMPRTRRSRCRTEQDCAGELLRRIIAWFIEYEFWILARFGTQFRIGQLVHFPAESNQLVYWNMRYAWQGLIDRC